MGREHLIVTVTVGVVAAAIFQIIRVCSSFNQKKDKTDSTSREYGEYTDAESLRMAIVIFRHGERLPAELYPNDPHQNYNWESEFGSLTPNGIKQMFTLGGILNARFKRLLPPDGIYSPKNMFVLSSHVERCLMSAQAFLAGFLPPSKSMLPITWQPIPVNYLSIDQDNLLAQSMTHPEYDKMLQQYFDNPQGDILEVNQRNADLYKYLTEKSGKTVSNVQHVFQLYDTLTIERNMGLALPDWTRHVFPAKMLPLAEINLALYTYTTYMKRVRAGPLLKNILEKMDLKSRGELKPNRSTFIYSAHDLTLVTVMRTLNVDNQTSRTPEFGAALVFELHEQETANSSKNFTVKVFYYDNSNTEIP